MLPWACSVIDHREHQNVVKTSVTNLPVARVPLLYFYHILMSSVIYYWTDAWQHGIYLLNMIGCTFVQATQIVTGKVCCEAYLLGWRLWEKWNIWIPVYMQWKTSLHQIKGMYGGWNQTVTLRHLQEIMCKADHKVNDVFKQLLTDIVNPVSRGQFGEWPTDCL